MTTTRRVFLKAAGAGAAALAIPGYAHHRSEIEDQTRSGTVLPAPKIPFELGLASYTFRAFGLDETIAMAKKLGLSKISLKSMHLPLEASPAEIRASSAKVRAAGLDLYAGGVIYMTSEAEIRQAFDYAAAAGMKMIVGVPNHDLLDLAESRVLATGISLAIHNHGPTDKIYPTPDSIAERIAYRDRRIGLCLDVGHTMRSGIDPADAAERHSARLLDVHIKDVSAATAEGGTVEIGRGVIDIPKLLRILIKLDYRGAVSLEYEKDEKDPLPGSAESIGYLRGALAAL
jgi:inosose dehydratase